MTPRSTNCASFAHARSASSELFPALAKRGPKCMDRGYWTRLRNSIEVHEPRRRDRIKTKQNDQLACLEGGRDGSAGRRENGVHFRLGEREEALYHRWIELRPAGYDQSADGFFVREAFAVRPRGNHRVERINDRNDARNDGNFSLLQPGGVALAVKGFVMMKDVQRGAFESGQHA